MTPTLPSLFPANGRTAVRPYKMDRSLIVGTQYIVSTATNHPKPHRRPGLFRTPKLSTHAEQLNSISRGRTAVRPYTKARSRIVGTQYIASTATNHPKTHRRPGHCNSLIPPHHHRATTTLPSPAPFRGLPSPSLAGCFSFRRTNPNFQVAKAQFTPISTERNGRDESRPYNGIAPIYLRAHHRAPLHFRRTNPTHPISNHTGRTHP
jgi:hypothetical protein